MRVGNFLVMRYAVLIGYSSGRRIVSLATRCTTLADALDAATRYRQRHGGAYWIARVGATAFTPVRRAHTRARLTK